MTIAADVRPVAKAVGRTIEIGTGKISAAIRRTAGTAIFVVQATAIGTIDKTAGDIEFVIDGEKQRQPAGFARIDVVLSAA